MALKLTGVTTRLSQSADSIQGNAPQSLKQHLLSSVFAPPFANSVLSRAKLTSIDVDSYRTADGKEKELVKTTFELDVKQGKVCAFNLYVLSSDAGC
jgi:hypothetical protein